LRSNVGSNEALIILGYYIVYWNPEEQEGPVISSAGSGGNFFEKRDAELMSISVQSIT